MRHWQMAECLVTRLRGDRDHNLEQALEDRLRLRDGFSIPTRDPDSYPEGTPGEHFGRLQSDQALLHAGVITSWVRAALAERR